MNPILSPLLLPLTFSLLGVASAQLDGITVCNQPDVGSDPGNTNYGDLLCWFSDGATTAPLITRRIVHSENTTVSGIINQSIFGGYEVDYVYFVNFGRERGVVNSIEINNDPEGLFAQVLTEIDFDEPKDVRLFLEVYGTQRDPTGVAPTSIKTETTYKYKN